MRRHAPGRVLGRKWSIDRSYSPQCGRPFKDAGITQFLQEEPQGFTAALKRSLFDFQVHEIDLQGEEIHLGAMGPPPTSPDVCDKWYLHFRLYKEGMDTLEAMSRLCRFLGRPPQNFRFAGHKDRCAVTVQQLSCTSLEPAKLLGVLEHQDWDHRLAFSHLEIKQNYLNLGDLSGNRFNVVMRQVPMKEPGAGGTTASDLVERRCESLKVRGFLNYFGPQRFGSQLIRSDQIGAALLEHDFSRALRLILGDVQIMAPAPAPLGELLWDQAAKEAQDQVLTHWRSGSVAEAAEKALPLMPKRYNLERGVLKSLAQGLNAEETLQKLPRHLLMLYVKAAQSRTFNEVLSRRVARHGVTPQLSDMAKARSGKLVHLDEETLPMAMDSKLEVVLPLPGRAVHCPLQLRSLYEESARELLGLPLEAFSARLPFDLPLEGVYRPIIVLPQGVAWRRLDASEALQLQRRQGRLLLTDRDRLRGGEVPVDSNTRYMEELCDSGALIMSCVLPPSSYFTMAFRELTRDETVWEGFSEEKLKENPWLVG